jgi:hypothetical protein
LRRVFCLPDKGLQIASRRRLGGVVLDKHSFAGAFAAAAPRQALRADLSPQARK